MLHSLCMDVRVGPWRRLSAEELMLLNCGVEETLERPLDCKEIQPINAKGNQPWIFTGRTDAEAPILWPPDANSWLTGKDPDAGMIAVGEGDDRGWDGWMASPTQWTWVWVNSRSWWWTGRPGVLRFMGSQRVGTTEQLNWNWTELNLTIIYKVSFPFMRKSMHWLRIRKTIQILSVYTCLEIRTLTILLVFWQISNSDLEDDGQNGTSS